MSSSPKTHSSYMGSVDSNPECPYSVSVVIITTVMSQGHRVQQIGNFFSRFFLFEIKFT